MHKSEQLLKFSLEQIHTGGWDLDLVNHKSHRTLSHDQIFGYDTLLPQWTYEMFLEHVLEEDRAEVNRSFGEATTNQTDWNFECRIRRKDGELRWILAAGGHQHDTDGQARRMAGIVQDITDRKQAEEEIRKLNERISTATKASKVGIWDWDIEKNQLIWDDQMYLLYGIKKEEFSGAYEAWINGLHPDDKVHGNEQTELALRGEKEYDTEFRIIWPDGTIRHCKAKGEVFRNLKGEPVRMVGVNFDITEQKRIDQKIREKDQEFKKLSSNVPDLIFQFTRKPDGTYCVPVASDGIRNIFGCTPEEVIDDFTPIGRVIYPEDAERVIKDIEYSAEHLTYFTCEFRVQIPGRDIQWIYSKSTPEKLPDGSITWYGFNTDITQKKLAEEEINQQLNELHRWYEAMLDREERILELKHEVNQLLEKDGYTSKYDSAKSVSDNAQPEVSPFEP